MEYIIVEQDLRVQTGRRGYGHEGGLHSRQVLPEVGPQVWLLCEALQGQEGANRIGGIHNCGASFTGSNREKRVWSRRRRIAPGTSAPRSWIPSLATM